MQSFKQLSNLKNNLTLSESLLVVLVTLTGLIHIQIGYSSADTFILLAGLGYISGALLFLKDFYRKLLVLASIPYTLAQIIIYYQVYGFYLSSIALIDKSAQVILILLAIKYVIRKCDLNYWFRRR